MEINEDLISTILREWFLWHYRQERQIIPTLIIQSAFLVLLLILSRLGKKLPAKWYSNCIAVNQANFRTKKTLINYFIMEFVYRSLLSIYGINCWWKCILYSAIFSGHPFFALGLEFHLTMSMWLLIFIIASSTSPVAIF